MCTFDPGNFTGCGSEGVNVHSADAEIKILSTAESFQGWSSSESSLFMLRLLPGIYLFLRTQKLKSSLQLRAFKAGVVQSAAFSCFVDLLPGLQSKTQELRYSLRRRAFK